MEFRPFESCTKTTISIAMSRNEDQTKYDLITPKIEESGWRNHPAPNVQLEFPVTHHKGGRLTGNGGRAKTLKADIVLTYKNTNLAVIEAKKESLGYTAGLEQAKSYAKKLEIPFAYATNGHQIREVDMINGTVQDVDRYPTPEELWHRAFPKTNNWQEHFAEIPYLDVWGDGYLRYYQEVAMQKVIEAVAEGENRILLTMATGTGKTNTAFQIVWKLFNAKWTVDGKRERRPRVLFLADRNILANQAYLAFLKGFETIDENALVRIKPSEIKKRGGVPKSGSIFFTIYQTFMSGPDDSPYFGDYPPDFFDFIIIDECHRGGANDESSWRKVLDYFEPATQLGLTATPKRKWNGDTYKYFGEPVYTYSLKEGINDGFLTPFRVQRFTTNLDDFTVKGSDKVVQGITTVGETYTEKDFKNSKINVWDRTQKRVDLMLENFNPNEKTLIFCYTQQHALDVRDYIDKHKTVADVDYVCRVTADDGDYGEEKLKEFQDNDKTIPTILTTSYKLSTGVDARNVRNIVFLRMPDNMIEFKQIIGRGTRLYEGKDYFTVYDFVGASELFEDDDWDGEPLEPVPPKGSGSGSGSGSSGGGSGSGSATGSRKSVEIVVQLGARRKKKITSTLETKFYMADGRLISAKEFVELLFGEIPKMFKSEDELRKLWSDIDNRKLLMSKLLEAGYGSDQFEELRKLLHFENSDIYDVLLHIAYETPVLSRTERASRASIPLKNKFNEKQFEFVEFILDKYCKDGINELDDEKLPSLLELCYGSLYEAKTELGDMKDIRKLFEELQLDLYAA